MSVPHYKFGQTTIAKVRNTNELKQMLEDPWLESETIIVKPNWLRNEVAGFTDSRSMRMLFEALDSQIVVVESHSPRWRGDGMSFKVGDKTVNWNWLLKSEGWRWLIENPDWDWFKNNGHWDEIKKEDKAFLNDYGFTDLFEEYDVEYVNVTDEVWSGRIADPAEVKKAVESRFRPVQTERLYNMVPGRLYDLRGSTLISYAKIKNYATFTMKNLFGMIPDPLRPWWHGPRDDRLAESIIDVNKVYRALFNVYGIIEALSTTLVSHPESENERRARARAGRNEVVEGNGLVAFGRDLVSLDATFFSLLGFGLNHFRGYINRAEEEFGVYDRVAIKEAKMSVGDWLIQ